MVYFLIKSSKKGDFEICWEPLVCSIDMNIINNANMNRKSSFITTNSIL